MTFFKEPNTKSTPVGDKSLWSPSFQTPQVDIQDDLMDYLRGNQVDSMTQSQKSVLFGESPQIPNETPCTTRYSKFKIIQRNSVDSLDDFLFDSNPREFAGIDSNQPKVLSHSNQSLTGYNKVFGSDSHSNHFASLTREKRRFSDISMDFNFQDINTPSMHSNPRSGLKTPTESKKIKDPKTKAAISNRFQNSLKNRPCIDVLSSQENVKNRPCVEIKTHSRKNSPCVDITDLFEVIPQNSQILNYILPQKSRSDALDTILPQKSRSDALDTILPQKSRSDALDKIILPQRARSDALDPILPKKSRSDALDPIILPQRARSDALDPILPKKSRSDALDPILPKKPRSDALDPILPKKSRNKQNSNTLDTIILPQKSRTRSRTGGTLDTILPQKSRTSDTLDIILPQRARTRQNSDQSDAKSKIPTVTRQFSELFENEDSPVKEDKVLILKTPLLHKSLEKQNLISLKSATLIAQLPKTPSISRHTSDLIMKSPTIILSESRQNSIGSNIKNSIKEQDFLTVKDNQNVHTRNDIFLNSLKNDASDSELSTFSELYARSRAKNTFVEKLKVDDMDLNLGVGGGSDVVDMGSSLSLTPSVGSGRSSVSVSDVVDMGSDNSLVLTPIDLPLTKENQIPTIQQSGNLTTRSTSKESAKYSAPISDIKIILDYPLNDQDEFSQTPKFIDLLQKCINTPNHDPKRFQKDFLLLNSLDLTPKNRIHENVRELCEEDSEVQSFESYTYTPSQVLDKSISQSEDISKVFNSDFLNDASGSNSESHAFEVSQTFCDDIGDVFAKEQLKPISSQSLSQVISQRASHFVTSSPFRLDSFPKTKTNDEMILYSKMISSPKSQLSPEILTKFKNVRSASPVIEIDFNENPCSDNFDIQSTQDLDSTPSINDDLMEDATPEVDEFLDFDISTQLLSRMPLHEDIDETDPIENNPKIEEENFDDPLFGTQFFQDFEIERYSEKNNTEFETASKKPLKVSETTKKIGELFMNEQKDDYIDVLKGTLLLRRNIVSNVLKKRDKPLVLSQTGYRKCDTGTFKIPEILTEKPKIEKCIENRNDKSDSRGTCDGEILELSPMKRSHSTGDRDDIFMNGLNDEFVDNQKKKSRVNEEDIGFGFSGFSCASGKKLPATSDQSVKKGLDIVQEDMKSVEEDVGFDRYSYNAPETPSKPIEMEFGGFTSAGGKKLAPISEASLKKGVKIFEEEEANASKEMDFGYGGFSSAGGTKLGRPSASSMAKGRSYLEPEAETPSKPVEMGFNGFNTAGGTKLARPSASSMTKGRSYLEPEVETPPKSTDMGFSGFNTAGGTKLARPSASSMTKGRSYLEPEAETPSKPTDMGFSGFNTAGGTKLARPSASSMTKGRSYLEPEAETHSKSAEMGFSGFNTAGGTKLARPSASSMIKGRSYLEPEAETPSKPAEMGFGGFNSAGGAKLAIPSEISILKGKSILRESNSDLKTPNARKYTTAAESYNVFDTPSRVIDPKTPYVSKQLKTLKSNLSNKENNPQIRFTSSSITPRANSLIGSKRKNLHSNISISTPSRSGIRNTPFKIPTITPRSSELVESTPAVAKCVFEINNDHRISISESLSLVTSNFSDEKMQSIVGPDCFGTPCRDLLFSLDGRVYPPDRFRLLLIDNGCSESLLTIAWVKNHYRLVIWKAVSMLRLLSDEMYWSLDYILGQMLYRYEMEINRAVRSCIKLIVEKDGLSSNHMVLCVFSLKIGDKVEMELTDGWYVIKTEVDHTLENHCVAGKIFVGQKLHIQGALLVGEACAVLEMNPSTKLKINANGTRRAKRFQHLGYQKTTFFPISIKSVINAGGIIGCIDLIISRRYPILYHEKLEDGTGVMRKQYEEDAAQSHWRQKYETAYGKASSDFERNNEDLGDIESIRQAVIDAVEELVPKRNVSVCLNLEVLDLVPDQNLTPRIGFANLSMWGFRAEDFENILEGKAYRLLPGHDLGYLKTTKNSRNIELERPVRYTPRKLIGCDDLFNTTKDTEIDIVLVLVKCKFEKETIDKSGITSIYSDFIATDESGVLVLLNVSIEKSKCGNLSVGSILLLKNLKLTASFDDYHILQSTRHTEFSKKLLHPYKKSSKPNEIAKWIKRSQFIDKNKARCDYLLDRLDRGCLRKTVEITTVKTNGFILAFESIIKINKTVCFMKKGIDDAGGFLFNFDEGFSTYIIKFNDYQMKKFVAGCLETVVERDIQEVIGGIVNSDPDVSYLNQLFCNPTIQITTKSVLKPGVSNEIVALEFID